MWKIGSCNDRTKNRGFLSCLSTRRRSTEIPYGTNTVFPETTPFRAPATGLPVVVYAAFSVHRDGAQQEVIRQAVINHFFRQMIRFDGPPPRCSETIHLLGPSTECHFWLDYTDQAMRVSGLDGITPCCRSATTGLLLVVTAGCALKAGKEARLYHDGRG
jgi:hypothetical protein